MVVGGRHQFVLPAGGSPAHGLSYLGVVNAGEGLAHRPEPVRRGDRLAALQLGGADVRGSRPAAGSQKGSRSEGGGAGELNFYFRLKPCVSDPRAGRAGVPLHHQ